LYKGTRLGIDKIPFTMYKFRTLAKDADKIIGAELLTQQIASTIHLVTPFGKFLRHTRLDELPQLFNILKGEMDFLGPRPERPEIYEKFCRDIEGYDERFSVNPGLIGYSQLFTPHSTPKKIRTLIDNRFLKKKQNFIWDITEVIFTIVVVLKRVLFYSAKLLRDNIIKSRLFGLYSEKRQLERLRLDEALVYIGTGDSHREESMEESKLVDINEEAILIYSNLEINQDTFIFRMENEYKKLCKKKSRKKTAVCNGTIYRKVPIKDKQYKNAYVIKYIPASPLNYYMVHQYFLNESVI
jgi:lipopolysaccharide/colanic/teichoic acid biosynthesis glycosyltransferase